MFVHRTPAILMKAAYRDNKSLSSAYSSNPKCQCGSRLPSQGFLKEACQYNLFYLIGVYLPLRKKPLPLSIEETVFQKRSEVLPGTTTPPAFPSFLHRTGRYWQCRSRDPRSRRIDLGTYFR